MSPSKQLDSFIDKFSQDIASLIRSARTRVRKLLPGAMELVYDNFNALAIGYGPTDRASDGIISLAAYPRWVNLYFLQGSKIPDPQKRLKGSGSVGRYIRLEGIETLNDPEVRALIDAALNCAKVPLDPARPHKLIIKSVAARQRPRRVAPAARTRKS